MEEADTLSMDEQTSAGTATGVGSAPTEEQPGLVRLPFSLDDECSCWERCAPALSMRQALAILAALVFWAALMRSLGVNEIVSGASWCRLAVAAATVALIRGRLKSSDERPC